MKVTVERIEGHQPMPLNFKLSTAQWRKIGKLVVGGIAAGIEARQRVDGGQIKPNAPSTMAKKRALGRVRKSLMDDPASYRFRLLKGWAIEADSNGVTVYPKDQEVSESLQRRGYVGWIGTAKKTWNQIRKMVLAPAIKKAGR